MRWMRALLRRSWPERLLLIEALLTVVAVRITLWVVPFRLWRSVLVDTASDGVPGTPHMAYQVALAVRATSNYVFMATCLTQAIATYLLLRWRGIPSCIRIGVARGESGRMEAHAWVESAGHVIIGGSVTALARFSVLPVRRGQP